MNRTYSYRSAEHPSSLATSLAQHAETLRAAMAGQPPPPKLTLSLPGHVTLRACGNLFEGSTGCHAWDAGFVLSEWVLSNPHRLQGELNY